MKTIQLTNGGETLVDDEDYEMLMEWKWSRTCGYAYGKKPVMTVDGMLVTGAVYMHRLLLRLDINSKLQGDHINRNSLDNRRSNLRIVTPSQNVLNQNRKISKSGFRGVSAYSKNKWSATIMVNGKSMRLGVFAKKEEAAQKYNEAAIQYHGEFAWQNIIT